MAGLKKAVSFEVQSDILSMLDAAVEKYGIASRDKALRVVMDYVATDGDWDEIFAKSRCLRCGGLAGWTPSTD